MNKTLKKIIEIIIVLILSVIITLGLFYIMGWYSFGTLPTKVVFIRMILVLLVLMIVIELLVTFRKSKQLKKI